MCGYWLNPDYSKCLSKTEYIELDLISMFTVIVFHRANRSSELVNTSQLNHCFQGNSIVRLLEFCLSFIYICINVSPTYMHVYHVYIVPAKATALSHQTICPIVIFLQIVRSELGYYKTQVIIYISQVTTYLLPSA